MLMLTDLTICVKKKTIINNFSYTFYPGKTYALMGPNGSGKSTLALSLMGHPDYTVAGGAVKFNNKTITQFKPEQRARAGLFLSFQNPQDLNGISVFQLMRLAKQGKADPLKLKEKIETYANKLKISRELLVRPLNAGASGGEKKKLELLQALVLNPRLIIFDEIDTGVDVDSLKTIAGVMRENQNKRTFIIITHYNRILRYLRPDRVLVIKSGRLIKEGGWQLATLVEKEGYEKIK